MDLHFGSSFAFRQLVCTLAACLRFGSSVALRQLVWEFAFWQLVGGFAGRQLVGGIGYRQLVGFGAWDDGDDEVHAEARQLGSDCLFGFLALGRKNRGFLLCVLPEPEGRLGTVQHHFIRAPDVDAEPRALLGC